MTESPNLESAKATDEVLELFRGGKSVRKTVLEKQYKDDMSKYYPIENELNGLDADGMIKLVENRKGNYYVATTKGLRAIADIQNRGYVALYKRVRDQKRAATLPLSVEYPIVIIAYEPTDQGDAVLEERVIQSELERTEFENNYTCKIKFRALTERERYELNPTTFVEEPVNANKIVRVKEVCDLIEGKSKLVYLTTWKEYLESAKKKSAGCVTTLHPYKWYDVRAFYQKPSFLVIHLLSKNSRLNALSPAHIATKIAILLIEGSIVYIFTKWVLEKIFK